MRNIAKPKDRGAIATRCLQIEREGGDVLAYLKSQGYLYTTEAVWRNLQREILHRSPDKITSGRPREGDENMRERRKKEDVIRIAEQAVKMYMAGENPYGFLHTQGYKNPKSAWQKLKEVYRQVHPEQQIRQTDRASDGNPGNEPDKGWERLDDQLKEAETPAGSETGKAEGEPGGYIDPAEMVRRIAMQIGEKSEYVMTCCAPGRESGVTVPDEIPDESTAGQVKPDGADRKKPRVIEVETESGSFRKEGNEIVFRRADNDKDYNNRLRMTPEGWKKLQKEIDGVLEILDALD